MMSSAAPTALRTAHFDRWVGLTLYKTYTDLRAEAARTYAGFFWWVVEPVISLAVYYIVFEMIFDRGTEHYVTFLFIGLVPFRWLSTTLLHGASSIINARSLMQQVYLPKAVFPWVAILTDGFKFVVVFFVVLLFVALTGFSPSWPYLALPLVIAVQGMFVAGLTLILSALAPFLPDVRIVLDNLVRLWLFLSGVFYDVSTLSERAQGLFRLNPMTTILESYRQILMAGTWPVMDRLLVIALLSAVLIATGLFLLRHNDYTYPKLAN